MDAAAQSGQVATTTLAHNESPTNPDRSTLSVPAKRALAVARILLGWIFLWTFVDKTFGLGYGTEPDRSWLSGNSPTAGYLSGNKGTFSGLFTALGGHAWTDWLFMGGMAGLGMSLVLGIGMRIASVGAVALLGMLWLSQWPLDQNPFADQHLIYLATCIGLAAARAGDTWGLGLPWARTGLVGAIPILRLPGREAAPAVRVSPPGPRHALTIET